MEIKIYTDGSSLGNPGQGGWAFIVEGPKGKVKRSGGDVLTTNNRMELQAVIEVFKYLQEKNASAENIGLYLDSKYVQDGVEKYLKGRIQRGRRLQNKKPVANKDLREQLNVLLPLFHINRHRVKGHAGDKLNTEVDKLAREAASQQPIIKAPVKEKSIDEYLRGQKDLFS